MDFFKEKKDVFKSFKHEIKVHREQFTKLSSQMSGNVGKPNGKKNKKLGENENKLKKKKDMSFL